MVDILILGVVETPVIAIITEPMTRHSTVTQRNIIIRLGALTLNFILRFESRGLAVLLIS